MGLPETLRGNIEIMRVEIGLVWRASIITETLTNQLALLVSTERVGDNNKPWALLFIIRWVNTT